MIDKKRHIRVLIVDGDPLFLAVAKECLSLQCDFAIDIAQSNQEAFKHIETMKPHVVVCADHILGQDSLEFLEMIRDKGCTTPFIVFTVDDEEELANEAFYLGANGFIENQGNPEVVYSRLKNCIESVAETK